MATASQPETDRPSHTTPPGHYVVLYDGRCRFCTVQSENLVRLSRRGAVEAVSFQEVGVLERFPGLTQEACMERMHLVAPDGRIFRGFEAAVRAVATRRWIGWMAYIYYLPGLRQFFDWLYAFIAARRYLIMGRTGQTRDCEDGTCRLHGGARKR